MTVLRGQVDTRLKIKMLYGGQILGYVLIVLNETDISTSVMIALIKILVRYVFTSIHFVFGQCSCRKENTL